MVDIYSKNFLTDEERKEAYWFRGEKYEFYTSYDPNHRHIHVVPTYRSNDEATGVAKGYDMSELMHDVMMFTMYWWGQVIGRLNGFTAYHIKFILHEYGWDPKVDGYEAKVIDTGNALNFDQGVGCE